MIAVQLTEVVAGEMVVHEPVGSFEDEQEAGWFCDDHHPQVALILLVAVDFDMVRVVGVRDGGKWQKVSPC